MTVRELIKILKTASPNDLVVMSSDPEGNSYDTLECVAVGKYNYINQDGDRVIKYRQLTPELESKGYDKEDVQSGPPCIVFWS